MLSEITIVSAFFDIGRGNAKKAEIQRSVDNYFDYFRHWARMRNEVIVYTSSQYAERVTEVRKEFGLESRTKVVCIDNIYEIETEIFQRMKEIESNEDFYDFRYYKDAYSNTAKYDYVMLMKYWCMYDAKERNIIDSPMIAWLDFGFDHGGVRFPDDTEFDFLWKCEVKKQIQLFALKGSEKLTGIDSLQLLCDSIMGCPVVCSVDNVEMLWRMIKKSMESLIMLDCIDDDQQLLLMAYRQKPELFQVNISDWFLPIKEFGVGGSKLKVRQVPPASLSVRIKRKIGKIFAPKLLYTKLNFVCRCYKRVCKYYKS